MKIIIKILVLMIFVVQVEIGHASTIGHLFSRLLKSDNARAIEEAKKITYATSDYNKSERIKSLEDSGIADLRRILIGDEATISKYTKDLNLGYFETKQIVGFFATYKKEIEEKINQETERVWGLNKANKKFKIVDEFSADQMKNLQEVMIDTANYAINMINGLPEGSMRIYLGKLFKNAGYSFDCEEKNGVKFASCEIGKSKKPDFYMPKLQLSGCSSAGVKYGHLKDKMEKLGIAENKCLSLAKDISKARSQKEREAIWMNYKDMAAKEKNKRECSLEHSIEQTKFVRSMSQLLQNKVY